MWLVWDSLFLGGHKDASSLEVLKESGITYILNCARELPCYFPDDFRYLELGLRDPDPAFAKCIESACEFIDIGRRMGNVLVHCAAAVSRSPAMILAYFCHLGYSPSAAYRLLGQSVPTNPAPLFLEQLMEYYTSPGNP